MVGNCPKSVFGFRTTTGSELALKGGATTNFGRFLNDFGRRLSCCCQQDSPEYQTIAGFLLHALNTVPQPGATVTAHGFVWTVVDMDGARIAKVKAEPSRS